jgi:hypothetical protein
MIICRAWAAIIRHTISNVTTGGEIPGEAQEELVKCWDERKSRFDNAMISMRAIGG